MMADHNVLSTVQHLFMGIISLLTFGVVGPTKSKPTPAPAPEGPPTVYGPTNFREIRAGVYVGDWEPIPQERVTEAISRLRDVIPEGVDPDLDRSIRHLLSD